MESPLDDGQLLHQCRRGDENALAEIVRRYEQRVYRVAVRVASDRTLADEATVHTFYKVWCTAHQWRGQGCLEPWILRIAVRTTLDLMRGRRRWWRRKRRASLLTDCDPAPEPPDALASSEERDRMASELDRAIGTLKEDDRILVHLYYYEQRNLTEIATILDATRDALKMRLARVRKRLRHVLEEVGFDSGT